MKEQEAICENCKEHFRSKIENTFLGFRKLKCPKCQHVNLYPLGSGMRNFYVILILVGLIAPFIGFTPGWLFIAALIGLIKDGFIHKRLRLATEASLPANPQHGAAEKPIETSNLKTTYCHECGTALELNSQFCAKCGTKKI